MSDDRDKLQAMFEEADRFNNFGEILVRILVKGFRCHGNTLVEIQNPITAFCGLNGTGKSTLLQLAAACYKNSDPYYIKHFMVVGTLDPMPFTNDAAVEVRFWQQDHSLKPLTLSRNASTKRWQGYQRRPERNVFFAGIGLYLPSVERRDFIARYADRLTVSENTIVSERHKEWTCKVLGQNYDGIFSNKVEYSNRTGKVISVQRAGTAYSEAHMGYGEGRSQYLISSLEVLPEKSLVLIEEPETSLHSSAQYQFGRYLVDVACRKHHQILLTTHSEEILAALPSRSRIYLNRTSLGIRPIPGLTAQQAKSLMAQGDVKALHILVEDDCARIVLSEIVRRTDPAFLSTVGIHPVGGANIIATTMRALQGCGLPVAAVRDADQSVISRENIYKLPGTLPPEKELLTNVAVRSFFDSQYGLSLPDFLASISGVDHHDWFERLSDYLNQSEPALVAEAARVYVSTVPEIERSSLVESLKASISR